MCSRHAERGLFLVESVIWSGIDLKAHRSHLNKNNKNFAGGWEIELLAPQLHTPLASILQTTQ